MIEKERISAASSPNSRDAPTNAQRSFDSRRSGRPSWILDSCLATTPGVDYNVRHALRNRPAGRRRTSVLRFTLFPSSVISITASLPHLDRAKGPDRQSRPWKYVLLLPPNGKPSFEKASPAAALRRPRTPLAKHSSSGGAQRRRSELLLELEAAEASLARGEGVRVGSEFIVEFIEGVKRRGRSRLDAACTSDSDSKVLRFY